MKNYVARKFINEVLAEKQENGDWKATVRTIEQRLEEGGEWETTEVATSCTDKYFDSAYEVASNATLEKFNDVVSSNKNFSLFPEDINDVITEVDSVEEEPVAVE